MKRTIGAILFVIYSIIAITVTVLLLSFNDYRCSEIGGYTIYIVKDDSLEPEYKQGSILLIKALIISLSIKYKSGFGLADTTISNWSILVTLGLKISFLRGKTLVIT